jgi:hypothetical protein
LVLIKALPKRELHNQIGEEEMNLTEILENLRQPIPPKYLKTKRKGGNELTFVSWYNYADLLDTRCGLGNWEWQIIEATNAGNRAVVVGRLTLHGSERSISYDAIGNEDLDVDSYGDPLSNASASAFRRACSMAGLSRELWRKEKDNPKSKGWMSASEFVARQQKAGT